MFLEDAPAGTTFPTPPRPLIALVALLVGCAGFAGRDDAPDLAQSGLEEQSLNLQTLERPSGLSMSTSLDGLEENVSPYGGNLSLDVVAFRLGERNFPVRYASAEESTYDDDEAEDRMARSAGLGPYWQPSWLGRFRSTDGTLDDDAYWHRAPLFEYPDGRRARWLRGGAIDELDNGGPPHHVLHGGHDGLEDFSQVRVWCSQGASEGQTTRCLASEGFPLRYEIVDPTGTTYRASHFVGKHWYDDFEERAEGWFHVTEMEDPHGNVVRIRYYGQDDDSTTTHANTYEQEHRNNTPIPRVIETAVRRPGGSLQVLAQAFVHLEGHTQLGRLVRVPRELDSDFDPSFATRIGAIVWPGANATEVRAPNGTSTSNAELRGEGWVTTTFDYGCYDEGLPECDTWLDGPEHAQLRHVRVVATVLDTPPPPEDCCYEIRQPGGATLATCEGSTDETPEPRCCGTEIAYANEFDCIADQNDANPGGDPDCRELRLGGDSFWCGSFGGPSWCNESEYCGGSVWSGTCALADRCGTAPTATQTDHDAALVYDFGYDFDPFDDQLLDEVFRPRVVRVELPHGAELAYTWDKDFFVQTGLLQASQLQDKRVSHRTVRGRVLRFHDGREERELRWELTHDNVAHPAEGDPMLRNDVDLEDAAQPLVRSTLRFVADADCGSGGDCGSTSVYYFGPPTWQTDPDAARTGQLLRAEHFDHDLGGAPGNDDVAPFSEEHGFVVAAVGRMQTVTAGGQNHVKRQNLVFVALPAFTVHTHTAPDGTASSVVEVQRDLSRFGFFSLLPESLLGDYAIDYDEYGNAPFRERYAVEGAVYANRSHWNCGFVSFAWAPVQEKWLTVDHNGQTWSCAQDRLTAHTPDADGPYERRETTHAIWGADGDALRDANLLRLPASVRSVDGSSNELTRVDYHYDHAEPSNPLCDGDCDSATRGRLTAVEEHAVGGDETSDRWTYRRYFGPNWAGDRPGTLAGEARRIDASRHTATVYERRSPTSAEPTRVTGTDESGAFTIETVVYDGWGQRAQSTDERGVVATIGRDELGREISSSLSHAGESTLLTRTTYLDAGTRSVLTETFPTNVEGAPHRDVAFQDELSRDFQLQSEVERSPGDVGVTVRARAFWRDALHPAQEWVAQPSTGDVTELQSFDASGAYTATSRDGLGRERERRMVDGADVRVTRILRGDTSEGAAAGLALREVRSIDPEGSPITERFDAFGRSVGRDESDGEGGLASTLIAWDARGHVHTITHPDGLQTVRVHDAFGDLVSEQRPEGSSAPTDTYDQVGQRVRRFDPNGRRLRFDRDLRGRVTQRFDESLHRAEVVFTHDALPSDGSLVGAEADLQRGRLAAAAYPGGSVEMAYDRFGNVIEQHTHLHDLDGGSTKVMRRTMDGYGNTQVLEYAPGQPDAYTLSWTHLRQGGTYQIARSTPAAAGRLLARFAYDDLGRLARTDLLPGGSALQQVDYTYDAFGDLTGINDPDDVMDDPALGDVFGLHVFTNEDLPGVVEGRRDGRVAGVAWASAGQSPVAFAYDYDDRGQLTGARFFEQSPGGWFASGAHDVSVDYDVVGNIETLVRNRPSGETHARHCYDGRHLVGWAQGAGTAPSCDALGDGAATFSYDAAGNTRNNGRWGTGGRVRYTATHKPRQVDDGPTRIRYWYDHQEQLYATEVFQRTEGPCVIVAEPETPREHRVTGREALDGGRRVVAERSGETERTTGGTRSLVVPGPTYCYELVETRHTVRGLHGEPLAEYRTVVDDEGEGQDAVVQRQYLAGLGEVRRTHDPSDPLQLHFHLVDHVGTPQVEVREDGTITQVTAVDPWGVPLEGRGDVVDDAHRRARTNFAGYEKVTALAEPFLHANARLYDPELGRFLAADPLAHRELGHSAYVYARNAPSQFVDPTGLANCPPDCPNMAIQLRATLDGTFVYLHGHANAWVQYTPAINRWDAGAEAFLEATYNFGFKAEGGIELKVGPFAADGNLPDNVFTLPLASIPIATPIGPGEAHAKLYVIWDMCGDVPVPELWGAEMRAEVGVGYTVSDIAELFTGAVTIKNGAGQTLTLTQDMANTFGAASIQYLKDQIGAHLPAAELTGERGSTRVQLPERREPQPGSHAYYVKLKAGGL